MNVLYVFADNKKELNCSSHNCIRPAEALNRSGKHNAKIMHIDTFAGNSAQVQQAGNEADIIVIERNFFGDTLPAIMFWRVRNKPMMAIFDDAYHIITKDNPAYKFWKENKIESSPDTVAIRVSNLLKATKNEDQLWANLPKEKRDEIIKQISTILYDNVPDKRIIGKVTIPVLKQFEFALRLMRGIQVPSRMLAEDWSSVNDTYYIDNYINPNHYINAKPLPLFEKNEDDIIVGWHGSLSHVASFKESGVSEALEIVAKKYNNVKIYLGGDKKNYGFINLPEEKKFYCPYVPENQYPSLLKSIDVAVAPLATEYDKRRSWIRGIEYLALQIPWIATNYSTYEKLEDYGILIDNGVENWVNAISDVVENIDAHRERAKGVPYEFALSQSYDKNMEKTIDIYKEIIKKEYTW